MKWVFKLNLTQAWFLLHRYVEKSMEEWFAVRTVDDQSVLVFRILIHTALGTPARTQANKNTLTKKFKYENKYIPEWRFLQLNYLQRPKSKKPTSLKALVVYAVCLHAACQDLVHMALVINFRISCPASGRKIIAGNQNGPQMLYIECTVFLNLLCTSVEKGTYPATADLLSVFFWGVFVLTQLPPFGGGAWQCRWWHLAGESGEWGRKRKDSMDICN